MSFNYDKIASKDGEHSSWWTSYADLFMMLSIVFLLMYVASSLRSGSAGFQQQVENKKLAQKAEALEQQINVYNTLKDESLRKEASEAEQETYKKLMSKLSLLQEEAREEKNALRAKAKENEEKEFALNQYQRLVQGIVNANILAKSQIVRRDKIIVKKDATIEEKKQKIAEMEQQVAQDEAQIKSISARLDDRIRALRLEQKASHLSKKAMEQKIAKLREESERKIQEIEENKQQVFAELGEVRQTLVQTEQKLDQTSHQLGKATLTIAEQEKQKQELADKLAADAVRFKAELAGMRAQHEQTMAAERAAFEEGLKKQRLSAAAKAKKLAQFAAEAERKAQELEGNLGNLRNKISATENELAGAQQALVGTQARLAGTENALAGTQAKLAGTQQALAGTQAKLAGTANALAGTQQALAGTQAKLAGTQQALSGTQQALAGAEEGRKRALAAVGNLQGDLERTRAIANARKILASQLADQFGKAGIKGAVDGKTGEVTLDFGGEYFETGSSLLKPKMRMTLDKFIPVYARTLFNDKKLADKIANVEIVGFASSTYKGKYVNPTSTRPEDKAAIEYNLKLSFGRANSIFKHVLNQGKLTDSERQNLLPLMKVVGRGYLPEGKTGADIPVGMSEESFCAKYNCKQAQKVIVKFNMKD